MTANSSLERRVAEHYATEPPLRAPDRVLHAVLTAIDTTPQRRGLAALRRYFDMPTYTKLAAAAMVIVAVGGFALWRLAPGGSGSLPTAAPSPSPTAAPSPSPTAPPTARPAPTYVPPSLTGTFTSDLHGLSLSYPEGWTVDAATEPWTDPIPPLFGDPAGDFLYDPVRTDHLFIGVASQALGETPFDDWLSDFLAAEGCPRAGEVVIAGAERAIGTDCELALATSDGRGYVIVLHRSGDDLDLRSLDTAAWFSDIIATLELRPKDALDEAP